MSASRKTSRKLSTEVHRKLSAISNCSDVSNISVRLGMDQGEFRSTISNILGKHCRGKHHKGFEEKKSP